MKPTLYCLLLRGNWSYRDIAEELGISRHRVSWFVLEMERRGWIVIKRSLAVSLKGNVISNSTNQYCSNISSRRN